MCHSPGGEVVLSRPQTSASAVCHCPTARHLRFRRRLSDTSRHDSRSLCRLAREPKMTAKFRQMRRRRRSFMRVVFLKVLRSDRCDSPGLADLRVSSLNGIASAASQVRSTSMRFADIRSRSARFGSNAQDPINQNPAQSSSAFEAIAGFRAMHAVLVPPVEIALATQR